MSDRGDDFEKHLEQDLREWTDPAVQPSNWTDDARTLIAAGGPRHGSSRARLVALSAAAVLLVAVGTVALMNLLPRTANLGESPSPTAAPSGTAAASPAMVTEPPPQRPPTLSAADLPLRELAWWNNQYYAYGYVEPPASDAPPLPDDYKLLRIGTLDGRISAEIRLNPDWSHSSVSGPVGTDVVIADDDGAQTSVFVISAITGTRTDLFVTSDLVPAAILSWDGSTVYYVKADRGSGADTGLWSRPRAGGPEVQLVPGPLGEPIGDAFDDVTNWWLTLSPDGRKIVAQWCRGQVVCRTNIVDLSTNHRRPVIGPGWPIGITHTELVADFVSPRGDEVVAMDLETGETRSVMESRNPAQLVRVGSEWCLAFGRPMMLVGLARPGCSIASPLDGGLDDGLSFESRRDRFGVALPDGWTLRWLDLSSIVPPPAIGGYLPGQLINVVTGERLDLGPFTPTE